MVGNAYSGGLASIMTVPQYEPPIDTPHQMAERSLEWGGTQDAWTFSVRLATQPDIQKVVRMFSAKSDEALHARTRTGDFGFALERLAYGSFAIGEYIDVAAMDRLQLMRENIYYEYTLAYTVHMWPLRDVLDAWIGSVVQSGVQSMWEWQSVIKFSDRQVQRRVATSQHATNDEPQALSVSRVFGAFIIWLIGVVAASASFVAELARFAAVRYSGFRRMKIDI